MVLNELHSVMATDALTTSHPLTFSEDEINTPAEISEVFDSIAYSKVGAQHRAARGPRRSLCAQSLTAVSTGSIGAADAL